jgi:chemotaxis protein CheZ
MNLSLPKSDEAAETTEARAAMDAAAHVADQLATMQKFIARRFDEISMEINATAQQVDMAEEGITRRFAEILEVMKSISYSGDGTTAANTGVELAAVVDMTEAAANQILDAADRIATKMRDVPDWSNEDARKLVLENVQNDIEEIFMACSFQDITGQRIRKTLENLRSIEERLGSALEKMGINVETTMDRTIVRASSQGDVDKLFGG